MSSRIKFGSVREDDIPRQAIPSALLDGQEIAAGSLFFLLDRSAWGRIQEHAARFLASPEHGGSFECAGLLAGYASYDPVYKVTVVEVREAVETVAESQGPGSVRIAPQDFNMARQQIDQRGLRVVGWYHTHPDYGIFLSSDDKLVIQSLFNASYHVALVYDPIRKQLGCFYGSQFQRVDDGDQITDRKRNFRIIDNWNAVGTHSPPGTHSRLDDHRTNETAPSQAEVVPTPLPPSRDGDLTVDPTGDVPSQSVGPDYSPSIVRGASDRPERRLHQRASKRPPTRGFLGDSLPLLLSGGALLLTGLLAGFLLARASFFHLAAPTRGRC